MTVDELAGLIEKMNFGQLVGSGSERLPELLDRICPILEEYPPSDQAIALAICAGMLWAAMEGFSVSFEQENRTLLTMEDRLKVWAAEARVTYRDAIQQAQHPDCPSPKGTVN